jgi:hypothetical protein
VKASKTARRQRRTAPAAAELLPASESDLDGSPLLADPGATAQAALDLRIDHALELTFPASDPPAWRGASGERG